MDYGYSGYYYQVGSDFMPQLDCVRCAKDTVQLLLVGYGMSKNINCERTRTNQYAANQVALCDIIMFLIETDTRKDFGKANSAAIDLNFLSGNINN